MSLDRNMTTLILAGVGIAGTAIVLRVLMGSMKQMQKHTSRLQKSSTLFTSYYRGGFEPKMSRREAGLILGLYVRTYVGMVLVGKGLSLLRFVVHYNLMFIYLTILYLMCYRY